jgi:hypothetical protein
MRQTELLATKLTQTLVQPRQVMGDMLRIILGRQIFSTRVWSPQPRRRHPSSTSRVTNLHQHQTKDRRVLVLLEYLHLQILPIVELQTAHRCFRQQFQHLNKMPIGHRQSRLYKSPFRAAQNPPVLCGRRLKVRPYQLITWAATLISTNTIGLPTQESTRCS